jgi:NADH-quinone oxidoreductase subunit C
MKQEEIKENLLSKFGTEIIKDSVEFRDQIAVTVPKEKILDVCRYLKEDPELSFDFLSFVGAVDRHPKTPRFEVVYQVHSLKHNHRFRVKALVEETDDTPASIESAVPIWTTANWHERETAEMFGIIFNNHPDPRKLLLPDAWNVHPLRKDFPLYGTEEDTPDLPA